VGPVRAAHARSGARLPGEEFILTARALGQRQWRILLFHLLPNCLSPVLVKATIDVSLAILLLAALSFLGVGAQPPLPEWGAMVTIGRKYLLDYPWYATFPGLAIFVTVLSFNVLGERVRDVLDPRAASASVPDVRLLLQRLPLLIVLLAAISAAVFTLTQYLPGDPAFVAAGGGDATPEMVAHARARLGLDKPLWARYLYYMRNAVQGDFGNSIVNRKPVIEDIRKYWPASLELALAAIAISALVGIPLGLVSAAWTGRWPDRLITPASVFLGSMPIFWLGLMAVFVFYRQLDLLPAGGRLTVGLAPPPAVTGLCSSTASLPGRGRSSATPCAI
jgi:ABC-type dipeptide/oligopeptide/nickel transport system permease component